MSPVAYTVEDFNKLSRYIGLSFIFLFWDDEPKRIEKSKQIFKHFQPALLDWTEVEVAPHRKYRMERAFPGLGRTRVRVLKDGFGVTLTISLNIWITISSTGSDRFALFSCSIIYGQSGIDILIGLSCFETFSHSWGVIRR